MYKQWKKFRIDNMQTKGNIKNLINNMDKIYYLEISEDIKNVLSDFLIDISENCQLKIMLIISNDKCLIITEIAKQREMCWDRRFEFGWWNDL